MMAERSDVCTRIALDAEQDKTAFGIKNLKVMDGTDPESTLYRTFPWRTLVESPGEFCGNLYNSVFVHIPVQPHEADIFLVVLEEKGCKSYRITEHNKE
jgi:hypothetical protein